MYKIRPLTRREIDVYALVVQGLSNSEIALKLDVKPRTVKFHMTSILLKYGLKTRSQLIVRHFEVMP